MRKNLFEQKVKRNIIQPYLEQRIQSGYGIVISYDMTRNTASVLMAQTGTDLPGDLYHNVPCPTQMGVQAVAPERGRQCWVDFKNADPNFPVITHFYNYHYEKVDYTRQQNAQAPLPRYMLGM